MGKSIFDGALFSHQLEQVEVHLGKGEAVAILGHRAGLGKSALARRVVGERAPKIWARYSAVLALELTQLSIELGLVAPLEMDYHVAVNALRKAWVDGSAVLPGGALFFDDCQDPDLLLPYIIPGIRVVVTSARSVFSGVARAVTLKPLGEGEGGDLLNSLLNAKLPVGDAQVLASSMQGLPLSIRLAAGLINMGAQSPKTLMASLEHLKTEAPTDSAPSESGGASDLATWVQQSMQRAMALGNQGVGIEQPEPSTQVLFGQVYGLLYVDERAYLARRAFCSPFATLDGLDEIDGSPSEALTLCLDEGEFSGALKGAILGFLPEAQVNEALQAVCAAWLKSWKLGEDAPQDGHFIRRRDKLMAHLLEMGDRVQSRGIVCPSLYALENEGAKWLTLRGLCMEAQLLLEKALMRMGQSGDNPPQRWVMHRTLSQAFMGLGQTNEAQYQLEEAVRWGEAQLGWEHPQIIAMNQQREELLKQQFSSVSRGLLDLL